MGRTFFVTGATGFLGSHIVRHLLEKGNTVVCLVRGKTEEEARNRLAGILNKIPSQKTMSEGRLRVVCGNITQPGLGIKDRKHLAGVQYFIHAAGSVDFSGKKSISTFKTNLCGSIEALRLARELSIPFFFHISTAYVSGKKEGLIPETLDDGTREFNNVYERSKAMTETALVRYAEEHRFNLTVVRPSIIVGDSVYGYIPKVNTIYNFLLPLARIRKSVDKGRLKDASSNFTKSGSIHLPLMLPGSEKTRLNLVPVDFVIQMLTHIVQMKRQGVHIYHIVDNDPLSMRDVVTHVSEVLDISGIEITSPEYYFSAKKSGLNEGFVPLNRTYVSYSTSMALHDSSNLDRIKPDYYSRWDRKKLISQMIEFTKQKVNKDKAEKDRNSHEDIAAYFEVFLKNKMGRQMIKNLTTFTSRFEIAFSDIPGTHWSIGIDRGILVSVSDNGHNGKPDCRYLVSSGAFRGITQGKMSPQECFFKGDVDIQGDIQHGLKLASLMDIFFKAHPYTGRERKSSVNEAAGQRT